jgi:hypothetical protein
MTVTREDAAAIEKRLSEQTEVWELTLPGRVHVAVTNHLGRERDLTAKGKGSRLRLSTLDRELAEEQIRVPQINPFRNGMLVQVGGPKLEGDVRKEAIADDELVEYFGVKDEDSFKELIEEVGEVNLRRLQTMAEDPAIDVTVVQSRAITELIADRYPIGGDTPTYREMMGSQG